VGFADLTTEYLEGDNFREIYMAPEQFSRGEVDALRELRDYAPDLPAALQSVIRRILHKDRELRCQSLREVQSGLPPVFMELQCQSVPRTW
jgi:hypothetical protein